MTSLLWNGVPNFATSGLSLVVSTYVQRGCRSSIPGPGSGHFFAWSLPCQRRESDIRSSLLFSRCRQPLHNNTKNSSVPFAFKQCNTLARGDNHFYIEPNDKILAIKGSPFFLADAAVRYVSSPPHLVLSYLCCASKVVYLTHAATKSKVAPLKRRRCSEEGSAPILHTRAP